MHLLSPPDTDDLLVLQSALFSASSPTSLVSSWFGSSMHIPPVQVNPNSQSELLMQELPADAGLQILLTHVFP